MKLGFLGGGGDSSSDVESDGSGSGLDSYSNSEALFGPEPSPPKSDHH